MKKITKVLVLMMITMLTIVGCSKENTSTEDANIQKVVTDREGNEVTLPEKMDRIISTAPSNTEVLIDLGLGDKLVAVDTYSQDVEGLKEGIETIDFSSPDAEAIIALDPDIIIASGHNKTGNSEDPFKVIKEAGISVAYIPSSDSIQGIYDDIMFMADITGTTEKGEEIVSNMQEEIAQIKKVGEGIADKKTVYFEIGPAPNLYSFGNSTFLNEMIEIIGAENILKDEKAWIAPSEEAIIEANPDVILTNVNYIEAPLDEIKSRKGWENIDAVKNDDVYQIDTNSASRPSHKIIKALNEMAIAIYPENNK